MTNVLLVAPSVDPFADLEMELGLMSVVDLSIGLILSFVDIEVVCLTAVY